MLAAYHLGAVFRAGIINGVEWAVSNMDVRENKRDESERLATCFLPAESLPPLIPVLLLAQFAATTFGVRSSAPSCAGRRALAAASSRRYYKTCSYT